MAEKLISCNWVDPKRMRPAQQRCRWEWGSGAFPGLLPCLGRGCAVCGSILLPREPRVPPAHSWDPGRDALPGSLSRAHSPPLLCRISRVDLAASPWWEQRCLLGGGRSLSGWQSCAVRCDAAAHARGFPLHRIFGKRGERKAGLTLIADDRTASKTFPFYPFHENEEGGISISAHPPQQQAPGGGCSHGRRCLCLLISSAC